MEMLILIYWIRACWILNLERFVSDQQNNREAALAVTNFRRINGLVTHKPKERDRSNDSKNTERVKCNLLKSYHCILVGIMGFSIVIWQPLSIPLFVSCRIPDKVSSHKVLMSGCDNHPLITLFAHTVRKKGRKLEKFNHCIVYSKCILPLKWYRHINVKEKQLKKYYLWKRNETVAFSQG